MGKQQNEMQLISDLKNKFQVGKSKGNHHHKVLVPMETQMEKEDKIIYLWCTFLAFKAKATAFRDTKFDLCQNFRSLEVIVSKLFFGVSKCL